MKKLDRFKLNDIDIFEDNKNLYCKIMQGGVEATYPIKNTPLKKPVKYVLMDLDGTSIKSEEFWIYLIEKTAATLLNDKNFKLTKEDTPFVSGFTTVEHLTYCIKKYNINVSITDASEKYHEIAEKELNDIMEGRGNINAFHPRPKLKEFLLELKKRGIKIGLATSGLEYKSTPEILSTFRLLDMGNPLDFYDAIVNGGIRKTKGRYGTMGELCAKPHPWIYAELGLGLKVKDKSEAIVLEDSSSGLLAGKLAGYNVFGFKDGNLIQSGLDEFCTEMVDTFDDVLKLI